MNHPAIHHSRLGWQLAAGFLLVLIILSLAIPPVRASLSAWLGLSVAPSNQQPVQAVTLVAVTPATPTATSLPSATPNSPTAAATTAPTSAPTRPAAQKPDQVSQLSPQAGFEILMPASLPEGYQFQSAYFDTNHQMVYLTFTATRPLPGAKDPTLTSTVSLTLLEAMKNDFVPMQISPDTTVQDVQINGQPGAYAVGAWDTQFVPDKSKPNGGEMVSTWRNDLAIQNLYWQDGSLYLVLVSDDASLSQQDLVNTAASMY